jgi:hypothetical protein
VQRAGGPLTEVAPRVFSQAPLGTTVPVSIPATTPLPPGSYDIGVCGIVFDSGVGEWGVHNAQVAVLVFKQEA